MTVTAEARTHKNAVLALLEAIANLTVFDAEVDEALVLDAEGRVNPYAVLYGGPGVRATSSLEGSSVDMDWPFQVTCAGGDPNECLWAVDKVCAALVDVRPTVGGRSTWRVVHEIGPGLSRDDDVSPPRFYVPLMFRLYSQPA